MKHLTTNQIRQYFLDFFHKHGHEIVASSSLVPPSSLTLPLSERITEAWALPDAWPAISISSIPNA
ncbi:MAG: hypothetical protein ACK4SA_09990, partial [Caldilinea sp.]